MLFITPFILTYLCFFSFTYLVSMFAFLHHHVCDLYQISKIQLGLGNGLMMIVTTLGVIPFLMYTVQIKAKIVTFFTWGSIGLMFSYLLLVIASLIFTQAPKIFFYLQMVLIGFFKSMFVQSILIMIKMHKEIYDRSNKISERNYKFLTNLWSAGYGISGGFFVSNWLEYTLQIRWEFLVIVGVSLKLVTTTLLFFGLRNYLDTDENDQIMENQVIQTSTTSTITFSSFFTLINDYVPSKLFLINSTILEGINIGFCFVLPIFFFEMGYRGNEGYLTAIYNLALVAGAYVLAISDYLLSFKADKNSKEDKKYHENPKQKAIFLFIFSVSLFFFVVTLLILTIFSFEMEGNHKNGITRDGDVNLLVIMMCSLGFFLGGPYKEYISYKAIKAMMDLQTAFRKRMETDSSFRQQEQKTVKLAQLQGFSIGQRIRGRKLEVGSSLITMNRISSYFATVVIFQISFFMVDRYLEYTLVLFLILAVAGFVLDVVQNVVAVRTEKQEEAKNLV